MTNKEFFIQCWENEVKTTIQAVKALPSEMSKLEYQPNPKARTARQIIEHILPHAEWLYDSMTNHVIDERNKTLNSIEEAANYYEKQSAMMIDKLKKVDDKIWNEQVVGLVMSGNKVYEAPMANMYWTYLFDTIHHRGQLSTYYRAMGVRNPPIYGPTAEDIEERMAAMKN